MVESTEAYIIELWANHAKGPEFRVNIIIRSHNHFFHLLLHIHEKPETK